MSAEIGGVDVLSVDWCYQDQHRLATAGKDKLVRTWDLRSLKESVKSLQGHNGDIVSVRWCPSSDQTQAAQGLLASCSFDGQAILWDLERQARPDDDDEDAAELMFKHSGHQSNVNDFGWGPFLDDALMCSVSEDSTLQIWQPAPQCYSDDEAAEAPEAKRQRLDG